MKLMFKSKIDFIELTRRLEASMLLACAIDDGDDHWVQIKYDGTSYTIGDSSSMIEVEKKFVKSIDTTEIVVTCTGSRQSFVKSITTETFQKLKTLHEQEILELREYKTRMPWLSPWADHKTAGQHPMTSPALKVINDTQLAVNELAVGGDKSIMVIYQDFKNEIQPLMDKYQHEEWWFKYSSATVWREWFGTIPHEERSNASWLAKGNNQNKVPVD